jgi:hypothetical protein
MADSLEITRVNYLATKALSWVEENMGDYSDEAKAQVMATLITNYKAPTTGPLKVVLEGGSFSGSPVRVVLEGGSTLHPVAVKGTITLEGSTYDPVHIAHTNEPAGVEDLKAALAVLQSKLEALAEQDS